MIDDCRLIILEIVEESSWTAITKLGHSDLVHIFIRIQIEFFMEKFIPDIFGVHHLLLNRLSWLAVIDSMSVEYRTFK